VTGERSFDGGAARLLIARLTGHDHVRIGAQERAHGGREDALRVHLHLEQTGLRDLDRILGGPDLVEIGGDALVELRLGDRHLR
jgi:hypothetical protein